MSGKEVFAEFCSRCHGIDGKGDIPREQIENMDAPPPDFTQPYFNSTEKRLNWKRVIRYGGGVEGLSMSMPAWGDALTDRQIDELVDYLKSFVDQEAYPPGELNFIRTHFVTKSMVEQEALLIPTVTASTVNGQKATNVENILYYANRFGSRYQYEVKVPLETSISPVGNGVGVGDVEMELKYAFLADGRRLAIASTGLEVALPSGSEARGFGTGTLFANPFVAAGAQLGDAVQIQSTVRLENPFDRSKANQELFYALSITMITTDLRQGFFPGVELVGRRDLDAGESALSVVPTLFWSITKRGHIALSVGTEIAVSGPRHFDSRWVAFLLWDYADGGLWW